MGRQASVLEVKEFVGVLNARQASLFLGEVRRYLYDDRPNIVLDCSRISRMDRPSIQLLLCCLEEAIKRNGDVKLAAVPVGARSTLKLTGVDRVFEIFDTKAEAVSSFRRLSVNTGEHLLAPGASRLKPENAALRL